MNRSVKPDRPVGVEKPHISFDRYDDGSRMVLVRFWPLWPVDEGWSVASGDDLVEAWAEHVWCRNDVVEDDGEWEPAA